MKLHPSGAMSQTIEELARTPEFKANLEVLQRIAARYRDLNPPQWWIDVDAPPAPKEQGHA